MKRKAQPQPPNLSFAEVTKGRNLIGVLDKGSKDGLIPKDLWRRVVNELHGRFVEEMLRCGGPPPECEDAERYQGSVKIIACQEARSVETYKRMVASLGEVYPGARLVAVDWDEIPSKPRARVWLTEKLADPKTILTMLKALERTEHRLKYGFEHVSVRIYKSDAKAKPGGIGLEAHTQEPDLEEPTEEGHPEGMSDEEEDILEGYTSKESDSARALSGVRMEEDSLLSSETEARQTRRQPGRHDISGSQHAYRKGRSTETALHEITTFVKKTLSDKEYALIAFLDIEGAFNNILPCSIINAVARPYKADLGKQDC
ncbi:hypothetical protein KR026_010956 [Drosophila bipectinata]|nr:hypothetical protein KR026_010956 [Drosophila bipectinata]